MQTQLLRSKRWFAACIAMVLMFVVSMPAVGIDPEVAADLRDNFLYVVLAYIGGQTANDLVTKGKTSGNSPIPDARPSEPTSESIGFEGK